MAYQLVTCPETAHIELIEHESDPLGMLIVACSHFRPPWAVTCPRTCAARLDIRDRARTALLCDDTAVDVPVTRVRRRL